MTIPILNWSSLSLADRRQALRRPVQQDTAALQDRVREIVRDVRERGDLALLELTRRFDGVALQSIEVGTGEFAAAETAINAEQRQAIDRAIANVRRFHEAQIGAPLRVETAPGVVCERQFRPIDAVGLYVPAGVAPLPSA
ncbi:MAG TPA: histidinol dehydrogenase, partial [Steroidobacteraceae bacterium]|nr:histidinol dehydrogenase [Steroidobacteraceae bacterium]